jgi:hypothetical protein
MSMVVRTHLMLTHHFGSVNTLSWTRDGAPQSNGAGSRLPAPL